MGAGELNLRQQAVKLGERLLGPKFIAQQRVRTALKKGEAEVALLPLLGDAAGTFVDIGANKGVYSVYATSFFGKVIAIEANPALADPLRRVLGGKGEVMAIALSDHEGSGKLWIPLRGDDEISSRSSLQADANEGFQQKGIEVPLTTLDNLALRSVAVVKIDVEGHEYSVLKGAVETLRSQKPVVILECEERHNPGGVARVFAFFRELGFHPWFLHRNSLKDGDLFDVAVLQQAANAKQVGSSRSGDYINNFLFIPPERQATLEQLRRARP